MKQAVVDFIRQMKMCPPGAHLLVGISGGPDSVALAHLLQVLGYRIGLAHLNYQLRGETSEKEEALVRAYGQAWDVPVYVLRKTPKPAPGGDSLQMAARKIRYDFFEEVMAAEAYSHCALGHQADDQAEQILIELLRGNDETLMKGIPPVRGPYIRPMLRCSRAEIMAYLDEQGLKYSEDSSNRQNKYLRNRVRNLLRPALQALHPHADQQLTQRLSWYQKQKELLDQLLEKSLKKCLKPGPDPNSQILDWRTFVDKWGESQLEPLVALCLKKWGWHGNLLWEGVRLAHAQAGKKVKGFQGELHRTRHGLMYFQGRVSPMAPITLPAGQFREGPFRISWYEKDLIFDTLAEGDTPFFGLPDLHYFDWDKLVFPLTLRTWQEGDRMRPLGLGGSKKLSDIFKDEDYDPLAKRKALVLTDAEKIILLSGYRVSDSVKLTENTRRILRVELLSEDV